MTKNTLSTSTHAPGLPLWDAKQTADFLGVCEQTARRLAYRRELPSTKVGHGRKAPLRFRPEDVAAYAARALGSTI